MHDGVVRTLWDGKHMLELRENLISLGTLHAITYIEVSVHQHNKRVENCWEYL